MRLHEISYEVESSTEHLGLRVDKKMKQEIEVYRQIFGKKAVAIWMRNKLREALNEEREQIKQTSDAPV